MRKRFEPASAIAAHCVPLRPLFPPHQRTAGGRRCDATHCLLLRPLLPPHQRTGGRPPLRRHTLSAVAPIIPSSPAHGRRPPLRSPYIGCCCAHYSLLTSARPAAAALIAIHWLPLRPLLPPHQRTAGGRRCDRHTLSAVAPNYSLPTSARPAAAALIAIHCRRCAPGNAGDESAGTLPDASALHTLSKAGYSPTRNQRRAVTESQVHHRSGVRCPLCMRTRRRREIRPHGRSHRLCRSARQGLASRGTQTLL